MNDKKYTAKQKRQIMANRRKAIDYLINNKLDKHTGQLADFNGPGRCCLGHMCDALNIPYHPDYGTSDELQEALGMHYSGGTPLGRGILSAPLLRHYLVKDRLDLTTINDATNATPKKIGRYLDSVIAGGPDTPFVRIDL